MTQYSLFVLKVSLNTNETNKQFYDWQLKITRSLATTNKSHVNIRDRTCKNFPHILFDHHAIFCCFSYCVHAFRVSQNFGDAGASPRWDRWHRWPYRNYAAPQLCYHTKFRRSGWNRLGRLRGSRTILGRWCPATRDRGGGMADPLETCFSPVPVLPCKIRSS